MVRIAKKLPIMSKTIAELLKNLKFIHKIYAENPILALPLTLFNQEESADLLTILWLYSEGWINFYKQTKPTTVDERVHKETERFYLSVKDEINKTLKRSAETQNVPILEIRRATESTWVIPRQLTECMSNNQIYKIIAKNLLVDSEDALLKIADVLIGLGISIPKLDDPDLGKLLLMDLYEIPELDSTQLPNLIIYILLFLFNQAANDPLLIQYNYTDDYQLSLFDQFVSKQAEIIIPFLHFEQHDKKPYDESTQHFFTDKLILYGKTNASLVTIMIFKTSPLLRSIFIKIWQDQGIPLAVPLSVSLLPSKNHYLIGKAIHVKCGIDGREQKAIHLNNNDIFLIKSMMQIAAARLNKLLLHLKKTPTESDEDESGRLLTNTGKKLFASTNHPSTYLMFNPLKQQAASEYPTELEDYRIEFEQLKRKISNKELSSRLSLSTIGSYTIHYVIDYFAAGGLIVHYAINTKTGIPPYSTHLIALLSHLENIQNLDILAEKIVKYKFFLNLDDTDELAQQSADVEDILKKINDRIIKTKAKSDLLNTEYEIKWYELQKQIFLRLQVILYKASNQIENKSNPQESTLALKS